MLSERVNVESAMDPFRGKVPFQVAIFVFGECVEVLVRVPKIVGPTRAVLDLDV